MCLLTSPFHALISILKDIIVIIFHVLRLASPLVESVQIQTVPVKLI